MTDTTTTKPPATAATSTPRRATSRPTVSVRPAAVGALNVATIAGATVVTAGGGAVLAALAGGGALAAAAAAARKGRQAKAQRTATVKTSRSSTGSAGRAAGGGLGRVGRSAAGSPGSRSAGSRSGAGRGSAARGGGSGSKPSRGGLLPKLGRPGGGSTGRSAGAGRSGRTGSTSGSGHRRSGSAPGSSSRSPLTAGKVAAARRKIAARRQPGPRLSDAIRNATQPNPAGKKPTARDAFRTARRAVTGDNPKNRGPLRRATAGLIAGGIAAGKAAYDSRQRRRKRDAARRAKQDRITARRTGQPQVGTAVRRAVNPTDPTSKQRKPAPAPVRRRTQPAGTPAPVTEGLITMTNPLLAISEDFLAAAARNQPEGMLQVTAEAHLLPQVMENFVKAMKIRFDRAQEYPLHPSIKEMYGLVHRAQVAVQQAAEEIGPAIEKIHEAELHRLRNPRVGEDMFDISRNRGAL
ncbi:hypothetical protein ACVCAH_11470 [Micromonospora sp. LZ34]